MVHSHMIVLELKAGMASACNADNTFGELISSFSLIRPLYSRFLPLLVLLVVFCPHSSAALANVYLAQAAAGGNTGSDCADARVYTFFNSSSNWGTGSSQIGPGTTVHLCGTITGGAGSNGLVFQGSGNSGNSITLHFENGAVLQAPYWGSIDPFSGDGGAILCNGNSYITIDGGTNGIIQNTANGSGLTYQMPSAGIHLGLGDPCTHYEIKNLTIKHMYLHSVQDDAGGGDVYPIFGQNADFGYVHNNTLTDGYGAINAGYEGSSGLTSFEFAFNTVDYGCKFFQAGDGNNNSSASGFLVHDNTMGPHQTIWTQAGQNCHFDGIWMIAANSGSKISNSSIYNNVVTSDMCNGSDANFNCTGLLYLDGAFHNINVYNNVFYVTAAASGYEGLIVVRPDTSGGSLTNISFYNNTVIGNDSTQGAGCVCSGLNLQGSNSGYVLENNIFLHISTSQAYYNDTGSKFASVFTIINNNDYYDVGEIGLYSGASYSTLAQWQAAGWDTNGSNGNPSLNSTYQPQTGSALIGLGANLTSLGITPLDSDLAGVARPSTGAWTAGVYQSSSSGTGGSTPTPPSAPTDLTVTVF